MSYFLLALLLWPFLGEQSAWSLEPFDKEVEFKLDRYIQDFRLRPIKRPAGKNDHLFRLGRELFFEEELSGNRNISCATCHHPHNQGVDWLPFSIGEGGEGVALNRKQNQAGLTRRNAPHLFNLGYGMNFMFWDGRVMYNPHRHSFSTPLDFLNGTLPKRSDITEVLTSAHSMQALFPMMDHNEMRGQKGSNELADLDDPEEVIKALEKRIFNGKKSSLYATLMQSAWPRVPRHKWNMGHLMEAIGHFETHAFVVNKTPWDKYLQGEKRAMNSAQKRGALVFFEKGQCIRCHNGDQLGGFQFHNIGVPAIGMPGMPLDKGLAEFTGNPRHNFMFKTPSLRNVAFTFPYMHNGAFMTLEQVVEHYDKVLESNRTYPFVDYLNTIFSANYRQDLILVQTFDESEEILKSLSFKLPVTDGIFTEEEEEDLIQFLRFGLSDDSWRGHIPGL